MPPFQETSRPISTIRSTCTRHCLVRSRPTPPTTHVQTACDCRSSFTMAIRPRSSSTNFASLAWFTYNFNVPIRTFWSYLIYSLYFVFCFLFEAEWAHQQRVRDNPRDGRRRDELGWYCKLLSLSHTHFINHLNINITKSTIYIHKRSTTAWVARTVGRPLSK